MSGTWSWPANAIVVDASAVVELLARSPHAESVIQVVSGLDMVAPDLINAEVISTVRRLEHAEAMRPSRAAQAVSAFKGMPLRRVPTLRLIDDAWALRANVSAYDALYVALARVLACPLVALDGRLFRAPGLGIQVIVC